MACGERAPATLADVLRDLVAGLRLDNDQARATAHILACRTGRLGGHVADCDRCGYTHFAYHSVADHEEVKVSDLISSARSGQGGEHSRESSWSMSSISR